MIVTTYRDFEIRLTGYRHPSWSRFEFTHIEFDGPEDNRHGHGESLMDCLEQIDEIIDFEKSEIPFDYC